MGEIFLDMLVFTGGFKDFSKIAHPLYKLRVKECNFYFDESSLKVFGESKHKLVSSPIIISLIEVNHLM